MINRRKFLFYTFGTIGSLMFLPQFTFSKIALAASGQPLTSPPIKETHLSFVLPLENRQQTNMIIIHHIGGTNQDVSAAEVHQWHLANGWAGIGYHYVIRKDGTIERGRPADTIGAHCYGYNKTSVGINIVGDFETAYPTEAQLNSGEYLTAYLCQLYRLNTADNIIFGHRDLNSTLCPGKNLYSQLDDFKQKVFAKL
ncbi:peptidoglycan recognition protein family protein [Pectinatus haikarae]|uniref:N-acetyl-anhydromuramyl-L-alanine amidase AmpD n=1 Tax=Pectinatus haikarae TaxID=349096 RepID=A0ABT9Y427_9FIRM|nr:peptidoglycan recognition family protein [Pectinatus haikarae]MDQ0202393.1 N-acetyl-anhydromuramyl-L-alanine amidase AmpD [Pectinatus haikarae]